MNAYPDNNPKTIYGTLKPDLSLIPPTALVYLALGFMNGAKKYGPYNWRSNKVSARIYVAAAMRHLAAFLDGEDNDESTNGSGYPHLGHAMACLAILADAKESGCLIDDRPPHGATSVVLDRWTRTPPTAQNVTTDEPEPKKSRKKGGK